MIQKIEEISLEINRVKSGRQILNMVDKKMIEAGVSYRFLSEGVQAVITIEQRESLVFSYITLDLENESCRENDNLALEQPIKIGLKLKKQPVAMTAMYLHRDWWTRPAFIKSLENIPEKTQSLYIDYGETKGYLLPMAGNNFKTMVTSGKANTLTLEMTAYMGGQCYVEEPLFFSGEGADLYSCVEKVFQDAAKYKNVKTKISKQYPEMFEYLGWCSWDAFYTDVNEAKVRAKVEEIAAKKIPIRWALIDDGWLSVHDQRLYDLIPEKEKFPNGFKTMIQDMKNQSMIDYVGVWHAFGGYWGGIEPKSKAAVEMAEYLYETVNNKLLPHPVGEKGYGFFRDWYQKLRQEGIDFVKVDGQSAIKNYYENDRSVCQAARGTHEALEAATSTLMEGRLINCMGMGMENILGRPGSSLSRNSDDFVPNDEHGFTEHLLQNGYNSIYHDELYYTDWDMFWTYHKDATKHGILRAVSGGPIYISDKIGDTVMEAIAPLIYQDGRILRLTRSAKPSFDCIFNDPTKAGLMKITNIGDCGQRIAGVIAVYNITEQEETSTLSASQIHDLPRGDYYLYNYLENTGMLLKEGEQKNITLSKGGHALYLLIPVEVDFAVIGLLNKYITFDPIETALTTEKGQMIVIKESGTLGFYSAKRPKSMKVNSVECISQLKEINGHYELKLIGKGKQIVEIQ